MIDSENRRKDKRVFGEFWPLTSQRQNLDQSSILYRYIHQNVKSFHHISSPLLENPILDHPHVPNHATQQTISRNNLHKWSDVVPWASKPTWSSRTFVAGDEAFDTSKDLAAKAV